MVSESALLTSSGRADLLVPLAVSNKSTLLRLSAVQRASLECQRRGRLANTA